MTQHFCLVDNYLTRNRTVLVEEFGRSIINPEEVYISDFTRYAKSNTTYLSENPRTREYHEDDILPYLEKTGIAVRFTRGPIKKTYILENETFVCFSEDQIEEVNDIINRFYYDVYFNRSDLIHYRPLDMSYRNEGYFVYDGSKFISLEYTFDDYGHMPIDLMDTFKPLSDEAYSVSEGNLITARGFGYYLSEK